LRQFQELQRDGVVVLVRTADELQSLLVVGGNTRPRRLVVFLFQRCILFRRGGRFVLAVAHGHDQRQGQDQEQAGRGKSFHLCVPAVRPPPPAAQPLRGNAQLGRAPGGL